MLLLWMSMICMIPFDMSRLDSGGAGAGDQQGKGLAKMPTMDRILNAAKVMIIKCDWGKFIYFLQADEKYVLQVLQGKNIIC